MASSEGNTAAYKMTPLDNDINQHYQDAIDVLQQHSNEPYYDADYMYYETLDTQQPSLQCQISCCLVNHPSDVPPYDWKDTSQQTWPQVMPDASLAHSLQSEVPHFYSVSPPQKNSKGRKKLRLYEYLHEALNDPNMVDTIQWTDSGNGTFHFISKNKEKLAKCWGQRKGNRKTMTYQKMARALRNYSRTGEIMKVRRKLTYQFNPDILHKLGSTLGGQQGFHTRQQQQNQNLGEQSYGESMTADWSSWYGHHQVQEEFNLNSSFALHSLTKL
ncbi:hypothetical protein fugu_020023 [Takifugu bimaculatus]|uniref:ETS domain-containing protein n=1 Tax=Takifugu bimaculatus TaxID=433685 RepID=A0A4Z2BH55_9TELE|nr:hypothetical protein fugu_020023 [Takifugu bimaculatus]